MMPDDRIQQLISGRYIEDCLSDHSCQNVKNSHNNFDLEKLIQEYQNKQNPGNPAEPSSEFPKTSTEKELDTPATTTNFSQNFEKLPQECKDLIHDFKIDYSAISHWVGGLLICKVVFYRINPGYLFSVSLFQ